MLAAALALDEVERVAALIRDLDSVESAWRHASAAYAPRELVRASEAIRRRMTLAPPERTTDLDPAVVAAHLATLQKAERIARRQRKGA